MHGPLSLAQNRWWAYDAEVRRRVEGDAEGDVLRRSAFVPYAARGCLMKGERSRRDIYLTANMLYGIVFGRLAGG